jgi:hypothetical protein
MDMASRKGVILNETQAITIPKTKGGFSTEQLSQRVVTVDPAKVDKFEPQAAGAPAAAAGAGLNIGSWPIMTMAYALAFIVILIVLLLIRKKSKPKKKA